jgi:hypothetical protein
MVMIKTRIKDLTKGDYVEYRVKYSNALSMARVDHIVTDMTHHRDIARVKTFDGKEGILTDNDSWLYVDGKVDESFCGDKVSNKKPYKENQTNDVQQKKRFEHLKGNLSRMERLHNNKPNDIINKPNHYTYGDIETIDFVEQVTSAYPTNIAFSIGNAIKYIARAPFKNGVEDLKKAVWYLNRAIKKWEK